MSHADPGGFIAFIIDRRTQSEATEKGSAIATIILASMAGVGATT